MGLAPQLPPGLRASTEGKVVATEHPQSPSSLSPPTSGPQTSLITDLIIWAGSAHPEASPPCGIPEANATLPYSLWWAQHSAGISRVKTWINYFLLIMHVYVFLAVF